MLNKQAYKLL